MDNIKNKLTKQQQRTIIICLGVIVASFVIHYLVTSARDLALRQQAMRSAMERAKAAPRPAPAPPKKPVNPFLTTVNNLQGFWVGRGMLNTRGMCTLKLELRDVPDSAGHYTDYSTLGCQPIAAMFRMGGGRILPQEIRNMQNPKAVILTGEPQNGAIRFIIENTVVGDAGECATSSFTVTPFGTNRIAADWTEGACRGGQLLLDRGVR
jgi:hypothetical protein